MKYELWDLIQYGEGEELVPFTKLKESNSFYDLYQVFLKEIKSRPCVIVLDEESEKKKEKSAFIYESPDKGKTVYRRKFGESERTKIKGV